jgi:uncharacterized protein YndB with AHSA1/START domain
MLGAKGQSEQIGGVAVMKVQQPLKELRFSVTVPGSLDAVWGALATADGLKTWLWSDARVDLRPGGDWLVLYPGGKTGGGTIVSFKAKKQITIRALAPEAFPTVRQERTTAVFGFEKIDVSHTRVLLTQTGWKQGKEWDDAYEYLSKGNAQLLEQLKARFEKGPMDWSKYRQ